MTIAMFLLTGLWPNILFIVLGIPLAKGTVPTNAAYGYRTRRSRSSPEMWTAMNKVAGWVMTLGGLISLAASSVAWALFPISITAKDLFSLGILILLVLAMIVLPMWLVPDRRAEK